MTFDGHPPAVPPFTGSASAREIGEAFRNLFAGRVGWIGELTLSANQTTTAISDIRATKNSIVTLSATTANAAAEVGAGGLYVSTYGSGSFTLTHANNAQTDRTFRYLVIG